MSGHSFMTSHNKISIEVTYLAIFPENSYHIHKLRITGNNSQYHIRKGSTQNTIEEKKDEKMKIEA